MKNRALNLRERWRYTISGGCAFAVAVYHARVSCVCDEGSLPGCVLLSSAIIAFGVFFAVFTVTDRPEHYAAAVPSLSCRNSASGTVNCAEPQS